MHFDADGYMIYHGRNDDVMNAMGYRVSPLEVEHCLSRHPAVAEVAVTELSVCEGVSVIAAFVVPRDPDEPDGMDAAPLLAHAHAHLAGYKCRARSFSSIACRAPPTARSAAAIWPGGGGELMVVLSRCLETRPVFHPGRFLIPACAAI